MSQPVFSTGLEEDLVQRVGTKLHLEVTVEDQSEKVFFEWRGPSGSNADDGRIVITETGNTSTAEITPLHLQDQGIWTCSAKNKHGVSQTKTNVLAQVPKSYKAPVFLEELVAGLTEQGTVSLECKVVGIPSPALRWFRDGDEIRSGDVFALQANMERPVSVYRCDAVNCMGTISSTAVLDISKSLSSQTNSAPVLTETLIDKKVKIGELVELSIAVSRVSLPVRVVWWNHGSQIAVGDKYSVVENAEGRYSVIINPVELCDDGEWKVSIENQFGSAASECTLTLRVPKNYRKPRFVENLKAVLTKEGLVSFECKVVGYPTPVLRWFKDGAELKPGDVYQLSGSRSLGTYSCLARNCMGEAVSTAALTVEDIGEKFPDSKSELRFLVPLQDAAVKIGDKHRFSIQVTYSPCLEIAWRYKEVTVGNNERVTLSKEDGGFYHCDINQALLEDEGEWSVIAKDSGHEIDTKCLLSVTVPKHYKKPRFLEPLKAVLTEEGAVNLECKVIGVPQPTLSWYKDGVELKAGDIHRLMSGKDGSCCLGTYTCVATNCMGSVTSSAALLGFEDTHEQEHAIAHDLQTPDISDGNLKPFSLSTIQEERTSQMMSPEAAQVTETLRQQSLENDDQISVISMGKLDEDGELSLSIGNQEVTLSLYQTPDLSEGDAKNICEMFADELAESISESNYVELPPLRFTKETAKASNINMEAIIIDIDQQDLQEYESMKMALENIDDLKTDCDIEDVSVAEWNEDPVRGMEFETLTCEEVLEFDDVDIKCEPIERIDHPVDVRLQEEKNLEQGIELSKTKDIQIIQETSNQTETESIKVKEGELDKSKAVALDRELGQTPIVLSESKSDVTTSNPNEKISKVVGVQKKTEKSKSNFEISWHGTGESVLVAGDFNSWQPEEMTQGEEGLWSIKKILPVGIFNLKFVVDGKWVISEDFESMTDKEGNINNQIYVKANGQMQVIPSGGSKQSIEIHKQETSEDLEPKETDTIKRAKKAKTSEKATGDRNEEIRLTPDLNDSTPSVTETENTVIIKESLEQEASTSEIEIQKQSEEIEITKENADANKRKDVQNEAFKNEIELTAVTEISEKKADLKETIENNDNIVKKEGPPKESQQAESKSSQHELSIEKEDLEFNIASAKTEVSKENENGGIEIECVTEPAQAEKQMQHISTLQDNKEMETDQAHQIIPKEIEEAAPSVEFAKTEKKEILPEAEKATDVHLSDAQGKDNLQADTFEKEKENIVMEEKLPVQKEIIVEKESVEDPTTVPRQKKQSRQESVVDSESIPDIETYDGKENIFLTQANKDLLSNDDDLDLDEDFEAFKKERRKSSYEETLAGMDPEILKELGLGPATEERSDPSENMDLSILPTETAEERLSRIEEKANKIVIEDDPAARKSRSRSRSRSKSRPPNLDTVIEQKKEEILESRFYGLQPSLDTIKESPSTASLLGVLQGGVSSASINTVLQGSPSTAELHKDLTDQAQSSPLQKEKVEHKVTKPTDRISEEKDGDDITDDKMIIQDSLIKLNTDQTIERKELSSNKESEKNECVEQVPTDSIKPPKKPKKKAQRSDTKLIQLEGGAESNESNKIKDINLQLTEEAEEETAMPTKEIISQKSIKDEQNKLTKEKKTKVGLEEPELLKFSDEQATMYKIDTQALENKKETLKDMEDENTRESGKVIKDTEEENLSQGQTISPEATQLGEEQSEEERKQIENRDAKEDRDKKTQEDQFHPGSTITEMQSMEEAHYMDGGKGESQFIQSERKNTEEVQKIEEQKLPEPSQTKRSVDQKLNDQQSRGQEAKTNQPREPTQELEDVFPSKALDAVDSKICDKQMPEEITHKQPGEQKNIMPKPTDASVASKFVPGYIEKQDSLETFDISTEEPLDNKKTLEHIPENQQEKEEKTKEQDTETRNAAERANKLNTTEDEERNKVDEERKNTAAREREDEDKNKPAQEEQNQKVEQEKKEAAKKEATEMKSRKHEDMDDNVIEEMNKKEREENEKKKAAEGEFGKKKSNEEAKKAAEEEEKKKEAKEAEKQKMEAGKRKAAEAEKQKMLMEEEKKKKAASEKLAQNKVIEEEERKKAADEEQKKANEEEKRQKLVREEEEKKKAVEIAQMKAKAEEERKKAAEIEQKKAKEEEEKQKRAKEEEEKNKSIEAEKQKKAKEEEEKKKAAAEELAQKKAKEEEERKKAIDEEQKKAKEEEEKQILAKEEEERKKASEIALKKAKAEEERKKAIEIEQKKAKEEEEKQKRAKEEEEKKKYIEAEKQKKAKEEEEKKKAAEEELAQKKAKEEEERKKAAEEEQKKAKEEEEKQKRAKEEGEKQKIAKEEEQKQKRAKEEEEKKKASEIALKKSKTEEERKKAVETEQKKAKEEEEKQKRAKEEEEKKKSVEAEKQKKAKEEEEKKKAAAEEVAQKKAKEEEEKKKAAAEELIKAKKDEEKKKRAKEEEEEKIKAAEEEKEKKAKEEEEKQKRAKEATEKKKAAEEEKEKKAKEDEEKKKQAANELAQKKAREVEESKKAAEKEIKRKAEEEEIQKRAKEEAAKKKEEEEKKKALEEEKQKQAREEEEKKKVNEERKRQKAMKEAQVEKKKAEKEIRNREEEEKRNAAEEEQKRKLEEEKNAAAEEELAKKNAKQKQERQKAAEEEENRQVKEKESVQREKEEAEKKKVLELEKHKKEKEEEERKTVAEKEISRRKAAEEEENEKVAEQEKLNKKKGKEQEEKKKANAEELVIKQTKNKEEKKSVMQKDQTKKVTDSEVKKRKEGKKYQNEQEALSESNKRKSLSVSEILEESSSEDLITITDDIPSNREIPRPKSGRTPQRMSTSTGGDNEKKASSYMHDNITLDRTPYQTDSYSKYEAESKKRSGISTHYSTQDSDRSGAEYSASRYKNVVSPVMDHYKSKDSNESYSSSAHRDMYKDYNVTHKPPTPDMHRYDNLSVSKDVRESRLSPTYDSRSRNISGDIHYRDTVEKSMQTSQNLMSVVTGSLIPKQEQSKTRPVSAVTKQPAKKISNAENKEATLRKKLELEKNGLAGAVTDIMIKEVGASWVSLCWKKPSVSRGSPVITYKVETWLCGEGAFWVELGRTPIPQFDAFNLKPNKCYHFRVTARNKRGWGDAIMTTHKVDLSRPTQMPVITSDLESIIKALKDSPVRLSVQVSGEPAPKVTWQKDSIDASLISGITILEDDMGSHVEISTVNAETTGKYTVTAANLAGRTTKSVLVQSVENIEVYDAYKKIKKWQGLVQSPLAPFMINGPRDRRIQVGQSIQLTCRVVSNPWPVVKWFKEDEPIIPDDYTNIYNETDFQHVQVDDVTIDHCGKYCVEAFNEHGSIRSHFTVIVDNGLDRYMPPFFTKELKDIVIAQGCNLLLHCRVESYPYIGVTWHQSGCKIRLKESDFKLIDDDGNVVLVLFEVQRSQNFNCTIMNEIAENSTACQVVVNAPNQPLVQIDEDVIRHSMGPRFVSWPKNQEVEEGSTVTIECSVENCSTLIMSRDFLPKSIDGSILKFSKVSGNTWSATMTDISTESAGLYFITARNSSSEDKYPIVIKVKSNIDLSEVTECALDDGVGAPSLSSIGPVFTRDGDDVIIKTNILGGQSPFAISWMLNGKDIVWSNRVSPYNRPGCIGIKILRAGTDDEGQYTCSVQNSMGQADFKATLLVDYAEQKESELMEELCNCPMLDAITPMMSWSNTPIGTPRRTPLPTPHATPLLTPRATPRSTPRATPRATPSRGTPSLPRRSYGHGDIRSPSRGSNYGDEMLVPPPRKRFVQAPEIFSSFSSKQVDEGASVELKCFISCAPLTQTTWEKDNLPLVSNNQMMLSEKTGVRTLIIHNAKLGDSGAYRMTITNSSGTTSCTAIITVKKKSSGSQYYASSQLSVPRSPYSSLGRNSLGRSSSSYSSYSSYRSYL